VGQARLLQGLGRILTRLAGLLELVPRPGGGGAVHEIGHLHALFDLGQVVDDGTAQAGQKAAEDQGHQPQATTEPFFGKTKRLRHDGTPF